MLNLGRDLSEGELKGMLNSGTCSYSQFVSFMQQTTNVKTSKEDLTEALRALDKEQQGFVMASEMRYVMVNMGECLSNEEVGHMLYDADPEGTGQIDPETFAKLLAET
eukprot:TRINITY_DN34805_c0_g1_i3.p2 TRINITY_DN34805_c0_g1~~TRINITY_DN34805_c0_g1_i3.p2  ORF type:complete len:108 (+),score=3.19 TRINITY_DN34805_c0_g1_i3:174-497(+)